MNRKTALLAASIAFALLPHAAPGNPTISGNFAAMYPQSQTDDDAGCQTCHASSNAATSLNAYGIALALDHLDFAAIEGTDSDGSGSTNLVEIMANTQPGWCEPTTTGCDNHTWSFDSNTGATDDGAATPPSSIALDPAGPPAGGLWQRHTRGHRNLRRWQPQCRRRV